MNITNLRELENDQNILEIAPCATLAALSIFVPPSLFKFYYTSELLSSLNESMGIDPQRVSVAEDISYHLTLLALQNINPMTSINIDPLLSLLSAPGVRKKILESETLSNFKGRLKESIIQKITDAKYSILRSLLMNSVRSYLMKTNLGPLLKEIDLDSSPTLVLNQIKELLSSRKISLDHQSRIMLTEAYQFVEGCITDFQDGQNHLFAQGLSLEDALIGEKKFKGKLSEIKQFKSDLSKLLSARVSNESQVGTVTKLTGNIALRTITAPFGIIASHSNHFSGLECLTRSTGALLALTYPNQVLLTTLSTEALVHTFFHLPLNIEDQAVGSSIRNLISSVREGFRVAMRAEGFNELSIAKQELIVFDTAISALTFLLTFRNMPAINCLTHLQLIQTLESQSSLAKTSPKLNLLKHLIIQGAMAITLTTVDVGLRHDPIARACLNGLGLTLNNPFIMKKIMDSPLIKQLFASLDPANNHPLFSLSDNILDRFLPGQATNVKFASKFAAYTYKITNELGMTRDNVVEKCSRIASKAINFYASYSLGTMLEAVTPSLGSLAYAVEPNKSTFCKAVKTTTCFAVSFFTGNFFAGSVAATATENFLSLS